MYPGVIFMFLHEPVKEESEVLAPVDVGERMTFSEENNLCVGPGFLASPPGSLLPSSVC